MASIMTLPGTAVIVKDDYIAKLKLYLTHLGYSEKERLKIASDSYDRILYDKLHRENLVNRNKNRKGALKIPFEGSLYHLENKYEMAREKYKPANVKYLLIAEAPPTEESNRFFYFENVSSGDSLFLETMKVLYPKEYDSTKQVRSDKKLFLERFMEDGFYLIDATDVPMPGFRTPKKIKQIKNTLNELIGKVMALRGADTQIILISSSVYQVCAEPLRAAGLKVVNAEMIDFPGSGRQNIFRAKMTKLIKSLGALNV